jgi:hypothetical protein
LIGLRGLQPLPLPAEFEPPFEVDLKAAAAGYLASALMNRPVTNKKSEVPGFVKDIILGSDGEPNLALVDVGARVNTRA